MTAEHAGATDLPPAAADEIFPPAALPRAMTHHTHEPMHAAARVQMRPTRHGLDEDTRRAMVIMINQRLADSVDLYLQAKHAHWNVRGMDFYQLHKMFDELAEVVEGHIDLLAERATALGGVALGTVRLVANNSGLPEMPAQAESGRQFVEALAEHFGKHARGIGESIDRAEEAGDKSTADLFTEIARELDESLYFLEAHLYAPTSR